MSKPEKVKYPDEEKLVERAKAGDKNALTTIVSENEQLVYNTALRLVGNREDGEDVQPD